MLAAMSGNCGATGRAAVDAQFTANGNEQDSLSLGTSSVANDEATITLLATLAYLLSGPETWSLGTIANGFLTTSTADLTAAKGQSVGTVTVRNEALATLSGGDHLIAGV